MSLLRNCSTKRGGNSGFGCDANLEAPTDAVPEAMHAVLTWKHARHRTLPLAFLVVSSLAT